METRRHFKRMSLWDFLELMQTQCYGCGKVETYFMYLDEIKMRKIESISEGADLKLKKMARQIFERFQDELQSNPSFCSEKQLRDFRYTVEWEI